MIFIEILFKINFYTISYKKFLSAEFAFFFCLQSSLYKKKNSQKRSYRNAKIKKLEEFWCENAVGIGLYNECVLWWGVRFERLLAALKSKRHKTSTELLRFWRKRTLGV